MPVVNVLLVRWAEGWIDIKSNELFGIIPPRRREATLNVGNIGAFNQVYSAADRYLVLNQETREKATANIFPQTEEQTPYAGWQPSPGAVVGFPDWDGDITPQKIAAITVSQDDQSSMVTYAAELVDRVTDMDERYQRWLKRMSNGAIGGNTAQASPEKPKWKLNVPTRKPTAIFGQANADPVTGVMKQIVSGYGPKLPAETMGDIREWYISVTDPGSTPTTAQLLLNDVVIATATIAAGATDGVAHLNGYSVRPNVDKLQPRITAAGVGATGWSGQARVDAIV